MCDTMVALGNSTADGSVLFAKNSDRQPNEPHIMVRVPAKKHDLKQNPYVQATYIKIPQVETTYEVILLKPSWIWGCEMGWNEHGLNIGNEAVFTKEKEGGPALIGMDMVRLALERCRTSTEALDLMTDLLAAHGQGGNCGYEKTFEYHNSFLIADKSTAWVLETAGCYWAAKQVNDIWCISNCLSIENDFDRAHPDTVRHAIEKGWCSSEKDFGFAKCYTDKLYTRFSRAKERRGTCEAALRKAKGTIDAGVMKSILRTHHAELDNKLFGRSSLKSVCMHAGGVIGDQTTGSYVAVLNDQLCTYWVTGSSAPCISIFKPLWMTEDMPVFCEEDTKNAEEYWLLREKLHRHILMGDIDLNTYMVGRNHQESHMEERAKEVISEKVRDMDAVQSLGTLQSDERKLSETMKLMFGMEADFVTEQLSRCRNISNAAGRKSSMKGGWYFRRYWRRKSRYIL